MYSLGLVFHRVLAASLLWLPLVLGLDILFPAYIWPEDDNGDCTPWAPIATQITAHPDVQFRIIINPDSGPVPVSSDQFPPFQHCIPALATAGPNVDIIAYVRTGFGTGVTAASVQADVSLYTTWPTAVRPTGIFFDEAPQDASFASAYAGYASFARSNGFDFIVYNPGTHTDSSYFASADLISTFENPFANFAGASNLTISSSSPAAKQAILLYAGPTVSPTSTINAMAAIGLGAIFVTDDDLPNPWDTVPTAWAQEVSDIANA